MKKLKSIMASLVLVAGLAGLASAAIVSQPVYASNNVIEDSCDKDDTNSALCSDGGKTLLGSDSIFQTITNLFLFIVGAISVVMIVIGGFRYTISAGDQAAVTAAKNTILYSVVGLVVAVMAYAIVDFVLGAV